jgi:hypothetical protein
LSEKYGNDDGIRWNDGNKWVKLKQPGDVLTFPQRDSNPVSSSGAHMSTVHAGPSKTNMFGFVAPAYAMDDTSTSIGADASSTPAEQSPAQKAGELFFLAYVVVSLAAGVKEIGSRIQKQLIAKNNDEK